MDVRDRIRILKARETDYPYVVACGRECVSSRGQILIFLTLASAIACRDELNRMEREYGGFCKARWEVKRLDVKALRYPHVFFEDLLEGKELSTFRDFNRRGEGMKWYRFQV